jgi:hypothetical protein
MLAENTGFFTCVKFIDKPERIKGVDEGSQVGRGACMGMAVNAGAA